MLKNGTLLEQAFYHKWVKLGGVHFKATIFGQPQNWSLGQLSSPDEQVRNEFSARLGQALYDLQVGKALAPSPVKFTDRVISADLLTEQVKVGVHMLHRNPNQPADGVHIGSGEAYVVSPSSCPITLMVRNGTAIALHTGRDCLIDRNKLEHGRFTPERRHVSVCHSALENLGGPRTTWVKVFWGIPPHLFPHDTEHPTHGKINTALYHMAAQLDPDCVPKNGSVFRLDLPKLIRAQCLDWGVPENQIDLAHAYQPPKGTWLDGKVGTPRNLMVLARHT